MGKGAVIYGDSGSNITIFDTTFVNNKAGVILKGWNSSVSISQTEFFGNNVNDVLRTSKGMTTTVDHSEFRNNTGTTILACLDTYKISISHSQFADNTAVIMLMLDGTMTPILRHSEFSNNNADSGVIVMIPFYATVEDLTNNVFINNSAIFEIYVSTDCRSGLSISLGSSHCTECSKDWLYTLIGIITFAFIAGLALVFVLLTLNMTVAVGTLNGILFYANIIATNADTYFLPFISPAFVTVFISWLNLDIGFDVCFRQESDIKAIVSKPLVKLAFSAYIIALVIIVIVAGECSSKIAKLIGKGNPVAVLTTMILLSYAKFFNAILGSVSLLYTLPAYGSRNFDISRIANIYNFLRQLNELKVALDSICFLAIFLHNAILLWYSFHYSYLLLAMASIPPRQDHLQVGEIPQIVVLS